MVLYAGANVVSCFARGSSGQWELLAGVAYAYAADALCAREARGNYPQLFWALFLAASPGGTLCISRVAAYNVQSLEKDTLPSMSNLNCHSVPLSSKNPI
jgi:hypothetical protein